MDEADIGHFEPGSTVHVDGRPFVIRAIRRADRGYQVAFEEVADRADAETIRNLDVFVERRRALGEREYWPDELVGLQVRPGGGEVVEVRFGSAQDRLVVERGDIRFEVPFVDALVPVVDVSAGFVEIAEIAGLTEPQP